MVLDESDREAIVARVRGIERRTGAQVVLTVLRRSRRYAEAELRAAVGLLVVGGAVGVLLTARIRSLSWAHALVGLAVLLAAVALGALAPIAFPGLERALAPRRVREAAVCERARVLFVDQGVHATRGRVGLLVLVSLLERRVEVVPDVGLTARVPVGAWADLLAAMRPGLSEGRLATAFGDGLDALERALAAAGLKPSPDANELPQELVVEPGGRR